MLCTWEQVRPLVLPLLATPRPALTVPVNGLEEGGASGMLVAPAVVPRSKIVPVGTPLTLSTAVVEEICAIAASTLLGDFPQNGEVEPVQPLGSVPAVGLRGAPCVSVATALLDAPKHSEGPG